ncbi:MAG: glycosyltransferase [Casimicrobiaceae bacterium]
MSSATSSFISRMGRIGKNVLPVGALKIGIRNFYGRRQLDDAMTELERNPWRALNRNNDVLQRLVRGWGNAAWSADNGYLAASIDEIARTEGPVLECGSGLSTLVLGLIAQQMGRQIWTLEHNTFWGETVATHLDRFGIRSVHLCVNPLKEYGDYHWYDPPLATMPGDFGLVICDGPPGSVHGGRYGMLPVMRDRLARRCTILLDDTVRDEERTIAGRWATALEVPLEYGGRQGAFAAIRSGTPAADDCASTLKSEPALTLGFAVSGIGDRNAGTIASSLAQPYRNVALVVSDDAAESAVEGFMPFVRRDARLHIFRQPVRIGNAANQNEVFLKARSTYFAWVSASDAREDAEFARCVAALEADADLVLAAVVDGESAVESAVDRDSAAPLRHSDPAERLAFLLKNPQLRWAVNGVIRVSTLAQTGLRRDIPGADFLLLAELALRGRIAVLGASPAAPAPARANAGTRFGGEPARSPSPMSAKDRALPATMDLLLAVLRAPLALRTKLACLKYLPGKARSAQAERIAVHSGGLQ